MVICLGRGADLHMAQLMPLPLTVSCFSKIQIGFAFLVLVHPGSPGQRVVKWVCVCVMLLFIVIPRLLQLLVVQPLLLLLLLLVCYLLYSDYTRKPQLTVISGWLDSFPGG